MHLRQNKDCEILHELDKITLGKCTKCNSWWKNEDELKKHQNYHCHLSYAEKEYFNIGDMDSTTINRKLTDQAGLPQESIVLADGKVKYDAINKTWTCTICNKTKNKYNRKQIVNHVNSMHGENKQNKPNRKGKGKLIEKDDYIICKMEHDYGRIRTECDFVDEKMIS